jgi:hypothetical protein
LTDLGFRSTIVDEIQYKLQSLPALKRDSLGFAYFYYDYKGPTKNDILHVICFLIVQLSGQIMSLLLALILLLQGKKTASEVFQT